MLNIKQLTIEKKNEVLDNIKNIKGTKLNLQYINNRINNEICYDTINKLSDISLLNEYKQCKSVQNEIKKLTEILDNHKIQFSVKDSIINDYILQLIPAG